MKNTLRLCLLLASFFCLQAFSLSAADAPASATVTGRVLNVATGLYLKNAEVRAGNTENYVYTGEDGSYSITVPAGTVELTASYTGVQTATASIDASAAPGANNVLNFDLQPLIVDPAAASDATGPVVLLDRFVVTTDREGQAKAIMDQRAAINAVTIISADNFGDITMDSIGEILKYMPGISVEYDETDATGVRIGGLDSKYTTASIDGVAISTSERAVNLTDLTATGVESIEFVQTLTASMDAGSGAGRINFRSRDPFSRRGRQLRYQFGLNGHSTALDLGTSHLPDDRRHRLVIPSGQINYGGVFFDRRLAIEANFSSNGVYNFAQQHIITYAYRNPDPVINPGMDFSSLEPTIVDLTWRPIPQIVQKYGGNLNLAWRPSRNLTFSLRSSLFNDERETWSLRTFLRAYTGAGANLYAPTTAIDPIDSTLTHWVVRGMGDAKSRFMNQYDHRRRSTVTLSAIPGVSYKYNNLGIDLFGGYTGSRTRFRDVEDGFFYDSNSYMTNVSWTADRPSTSSPTWTITQTDGDPWNDPINWSKRDIYSYGITSRPDRTKTDQYVGTLDLSYNLNILGAPATLKTGAFLRRNDYTRRYRTTSYNYLGPTGRPHEAIIPYSQNYLFDFPLGGKGGNISDQGWRIDDTYALYSIYQQHPEWFYQNYFSNLRSQFTGRRDFTESIEACYVELNSRINRVRFNVGMRLESTDAEAQQVHRRPGSQVSAAGYPVGANGTATTEEGTYYQYYNGERFARRNNYTNLFLSGGFKFDITRNLQGHFSASQSILRPDYINLAGVVTFEDTDNIITIPNALLKPEYMTKYYAGLNWRLEPAGTLNLTCYRLDIKDKQIRGVDITQEEAERVIGYPLGIVDGDGTIIDMDDPEGLFWHTIFRTTINSPSRLSVYGVTLAYDQQLSYLPGYLKGLSIFGSVTCSTIRGSQIDEDRIGQLKRSLNGGIRYRLSRFHVQIRGTWNAVALAAVNRIVEGNFYYSQDLQYSKARLVVDLSGGFKLTNRYEIAFSIRNLFDAPQIWYSQSPDRLSRYTLSGSLWNINLRGTF